MNHQHNPLSHLKPLSSNIGLRPNTISPHQRFTPNMDSFKIYETLVNKETDTPETDNKTVSSGTLHSTRIQIMVSSTCPDKSTVALLNATEQLIAALFNKLPGLLLAPWQITDDTCEKKLLKKSIPTKIEEAEKYIYFSASSILVGMDFLRSFFSQVSSVICHGASKRPGSLLKSAAISCSVALRSATVDLSGQVEETMI